MIHVDKIEFYITNVCNFSCSNCNRLNNYKFSGHQNWDDYKDIYKKWSKRLSFDRISILGGEPTLNPSFRDWCKGIREFWPDAEIELLTNGSTLSKTFKDYYEFCLQYNIILDIQCHNRDRYLPLYRKICSSMSGEVTKQFVGNLDGWADAYKRVKDDSWPDCDHINQLDKLPAYIQKECIEVFKIGAEDYLFNSNGIRLQDSSGVKINLAYAEDFVTAPLKYSGNNIFSVYNSDPEQAHDVCISKYCHHFIKGKLYKCHHVALLPEFMQQYYVDIDENDKNLLNSYVPADITFNDKELEVFIKNLANVIDQCKLCPSKLSSHQLDGTLPKPNVKKIPLVTVE